MSNHFYNRLPPIVNVGDTVRFHRFNKADNIVEAAVLGLDQHHGQPIFTYNPGGDTDETHWDYVSTVETVVPPPDSRR